VSLTSCLSSAVRENQRGQTVGDWVGYQEETDVGRLDIVGSTVLKIYQILLGCIKKNMLDKTT